MAGGLRFMRRDAELLSKQAIQQSRFTDVGPPYYRYQPTTGIGSCFALWALGAFRGGTGCTASSINGTILCTFSSFFAGGSRVFRSIQKFGHQQRICSVHVALKVRVLQITEAAGFGFSTVSAVIACKRLSAVRKSARPFADVALRAAICRVRDPHCQELQQLKPARPYACYWPSRWH